MDRQEIGPAAQPGHGRRGALAATLAFGAALAVLPRAALAQARLRVVTTTSDLRSLVQAVGGDRVDAVHLAPPEADVEHYAIRPQDLARVREADLVVRVGADFDLWFDALLKRTDRAELQRGGPRHVDASAGIALLEVRGTAIGAGDGHAHGAGNPHYWLDPANAEGVTATLLEGLARLDPPNARACESRRIAFIDRLRGRQPEWLAMLVPLARRPLLAQHNSWAYFARRFRLEFAGFIEPRPGVPPSPAHLNALLALMRERGIATIVRQPHESARTADFLAARSGARVVVLAASVGALPGTDDYLALIDHNVRALAAAP